jgi:ATP-dependent RNA helicase UAP56/SUB2
MKKNKGM